MSHERAHKDYGVMVIKYLQNPEVIIANQHRSRYIPFSDRHLLSHNIDKVRPHVLDLSLAMRAHKLTHTPYSGQLRSTPLLQRLPPTLCTR